MDVKKTVKYDGKIKGLHFEGNELIDENGEVIELNRYMKAAYADKLFDISVTAKEEEIIEYEMADYEYEDDEEDEE